MIYDGTGVHSNGEASVDRGIGTSSFSDDTANVVNTSVGVGFKYTLNLQRPISQNGGTDSMMKKTLDEWYTTNIVNRGYDSYVATQAGFCNDRDTVTGSWSANGSVSYLAYGRLVSNKKPTLKCSNDLDLYTTKVGLITADEVAYAGGVNNLNNISYYLYMGETFYTISPYNFQYTLYYRLSYMFLVHDQGQILGGNNSANVAAAVRPVINLDANVTIKSGIGTSSDPYVI
ncbi:unknown [Mycoplasma sp. CAG:776]|nr:unknown [Mycoplasma sp. CAG:776]